MNFSHQIHFNFKGCLHFLIRMGLATVLISSHAKADGVILIKSHPSQSPQFWRVFHFTKNEPSPYSYNVTLLNGQQQNFFRTEVGAILEEPKWSELIITSDAEWQKLEQQKTKLLDSLGQFPQLKNWSGSLAAKFDNLLDKNSPTTVIYRGSVISRDDYNKLRGLVSPSDSGNIEKGVMPELTIGSVKLTNVKLKSFNETRVSLVHSNGIQGYNLTDLQETEISSLSKAFPEFADHMKKLASEASANPSNSKKAATEDKMTPNSNGLANLPLSKILSAAKLRKEILIQIASASKEISAQIDQPISEDLFPDVLYNKVKNYLQSIRLADNMHGKLTHLFFTVRGKLSKNKFPNLYEGPTGASLDSIPGAVYEVTDDNTGSAAIITVMATNQTTKFQPGASCEGYFHFEFTKEVDLESGFVSEINFYKAPRWDQQEMIRNMNLERDLENLKSLYEKLDAM